MMNVLVPEATRRGFETDSIVCVSDVPAGRPEPWMALRSAMELRAYPPALCVKVGDTVPDIQEGLNAGMWTSRRGADRQRTGPDNRRNWLPCRWMSWRRGASERTSAWRTPARTT